MNAARQLIESLLDGASAKTVMLDMRQPWRVLLRLGYTVAPMWTGLGHSKVYAGKGQIGLAVSMTFDKSAYTDNEGRTVKPHADGIVVQIRLFSAEKTSEGAWRIIRNGSLYYWNFQHIANVSDELVAFDKLCASAYENAVGNDAHGGRTAVEQYLRRKTYTVSENYTVIPNRIEVFP